VSLPAKSARRPILCYVTDSRALTEDLANRRDALLERIAAASPAGIDWIQIREKDLSGREISALTAAAIAKTKNSTQQGASSAKIIVNDRVDVAITNHAQGVHLGGNSMPAKNICDWLKRNADRHAATVQQNFEVGVSCHSLKEALAAEKSGATYIFFGPIFATPSKQTFGPPQGLSRLAEVCNAVKIPALAIGGITTQNAQSCLNAGAAGLAAIRLFQNSQDLPSLVAGLRWQQSA
jgi:thiamine-phosphate pyrophosphorylase